MTNKTICLNRSVLEFMDRIIEPDSWVLEIGGGWSSRWFADRCGSLTIVETHPKWQRTIRRELNGNTCNWYVSPDFATIQRFRGFDVALVDCAPKLRDEGASFALERLLVGGWLLFDDAQRSEHAATVTWIENMLGAGIMLFWQEGDIETARERITLAWQKT